MVEKLYYMNPALGAPYGEVDRIDYYSQTASGYSLMRSRPYNPMEEAYRYALRNLEDSFEREMRMLYELSAPYNYNYSDDYYRREHEIKSYYYSRRDRMESDFTRNVQQYYYGYANPSYRSLQYLGWDYGSSPSYSYSFTYLNSKETTPVPTETKKYIILDSSNDPTTYFSNNDDEKVFIPFATLAEAEKKAQNLARENPEEEFTIYQTVKKYKVAGTPLDTVVFV